MSASPREILDFYLPSMDYLHKNNWTSLNFAAQLPEQYKHVTANVTQTYQWLMSLGDPRVADWPLMASPWPTAAISIAYVLMCLYVPKTFKGLAKETVTPLLLAYNIGNILLNAYVVYELIPASREYNWICQPVSYTNDPKEIRVASALWFYYVSKLIEMLDSAFFIIRGKHNLINAFFLDIPD